MISTPTTLEANAAGVRRQRTHYVVAHSLTQAIRNAASLMSTDVNLVITNPLPRRATSRENPIVTGDADFKSISADHNIF